MVTDNHYRWDFIGLSTDTKPTPATSDKVVDGSTYYCSDTSKLYVYCTDDWYERKPLGGGGTSYTAGDGIDITENEISVDTTTIQEKLTAGTNITISDENVISASASGGDSVYSTKNTSTSNTGGAVYIGNKNSSQEVIGDPTVTNIHAKYFWGLPAINSIIPKSGQVILLGYPLDDNSTNAVAIGGASRAGTDSIAIGANSDSSNSGTITIGTSAYADKIGAIALGYGARPTRKGELNISTVNTSYGFSNTKYRVIGGVHDGKDLHDVATVAQGNTLATSAPTTTTEGVLGQLYTDTTAMHTYQLTAIDTTDPNNPSYTWTQRW